MPFGWAPTSCIGAGLGTMQQILLCELMTTRYRIEPAEPARMRVALGAVPLPLDFHGVVTARRG